MKSLQERMESIFIDIFKKNVLPRIKELIVRWGQDGLDKAKWDNLWNAELLIRGLGRDGIYFSPEARIWLVKQLEEVKALVIGKNDPLNKQYLQKKYSKGDIIDPERRIDKILREL